MSTAPIPCSSFSRAASSSPVIFTDSDTEHAASSSYSLSPSPFASPLSIFAHSEDPGPNKITSTSSCSSFSPIPNLSQLSGFTHQDTFIEKSMSTSPVSSSSSLARPSMLYPKTSCSLVSHELSSEEDREKYISKQKAIISRNMRIIRSFDCLTSKLHKTFESAQKQMEKEIQKSFFYHEKGLCGRMFQEYYSEEDSRIGRSFTVGVSQDRGESQVIEQTYLLFRHSFNCESGKKVNARFFCLFDDPIMNGHSANYAKGHLPGLLEKYLTKYNEKKLSIPGIWNALQSAFVQASVSHIGEKGTAAAVVMILANKVWVASRGKIVVVLDNQGTAIRLNYVNNEGIGSTCLEEGKSARCKIISYPLNEIEPGSHIILSCQNVFRVINSKEMVKTAHQSKDHAGQLAQNFVSSAKVGVGRSLGSRSVMVIAL